MYLKTAHIINSGPLRRFDVNMEFSPEGNPKPLVLVGANGGGKTNFLSLVTDALFEGAAVHYNNVLPTRGTSRAWFRVVGGRTTTLGEAGGFSLLQFMHQGQSLFYKEKSGNLNNDNLKASAPIHLREEMNWPPDGPYKEFALSHEISQKIFKEGVYVYFPSSRSEIPFWLNKESVENEEFDTFTSITNNLRKPIFVERSIQQLKQWLLSLITDSRLEFSLPTPGTNNAQPTSATTISVISRTSLEVVNILLKKILGDEEVRFGWLGRKNPEKIGIYKNDHLLLTTLDGLSSGQSILLGMFVTILRYGDLSSSRVDIDPSSIEGICVIDEVDSHIHIDLQHHILPELISIFPRMQFIVSSHSPIFVLGMQNTFGADGFQLVEMPSGNTVTTENYSEFRKAMEVLTATNSFNRNLINDSSKSGLPLILTEGETDAPYLRRAAYLFGRETILQRCEIEWIGAKDEKGQGFNTGKAALDHTLAVLRANPQLANRPICLLYDNDARKSDTNYANIIVRSIPTNEKNSKIRCGIENLLDESSIMEDDYQTTHKIQDNGDIITRKTLRKSDLCSRLVIAGTKADFQYFCGVLDLIERFLDHVDNG